MNAFGGIQSIVSYQVLLVEIDFLGGISSLCYTECSEADIVQLFEWLDCVQIAFVCEINKGGYSQFVIYNGGFLKSQYILCW